MIASHACIRAMQDLFTEEAYRGMLEIVKYARYVEGQQQLEEGPGKDTDTAARVTLNSVLALGDDLALSGLAAIAGCSLCETNRVTLEKAWQVVANEFYDAHGKFSQEAWARALLQTLKVGCLRQLLCGHTAIMHQSLL